MSIKSSSLTNDQLDYLRDKLRIKILPSNGRYGTEYYIYACKEDGDTIYIPFAIARSINLKAQHHTRLPTCGSFKGILRDKQIEVRNEAIKMLNDNGFVLMSMHTGFGKTVTSLYIANQIRMRTCIIVKGLVLCRQWKESIQAFLPDVGVKICTAKDKQDPGTQFVIVNAINVSKLTWTSNIGLLIVDECHQIVSKVLSESLLCFCPKYLIGLSATPYRNDGFDSLLKLYFGDNIISREMVRYHTVYHVPTLLEPDIEYSASDGTIIWNSVLNSQASCKWRNDFIVNLTQKFKSKTILILCKRVEQIDYLVDELQKLGENACGLFRKSSSVVAGSRIIIGIAAKAGTGFDHKDLDMLILAADVEAYFIQYLGRVFRREDVEPIIIDIVDNHRVLHKHFATRRTAYKKHGGTIVKKTMEMILSE